MTDEWWKDLKPPEDKQSGISDCEQPDTSNDRTPSIKKVNSMAGSGCLFQGLGIASCIAGVALFFTILGPIFLIPLGLWLMYYGGKKAQWFECSDCGTKLANKRLIICPNCKGKFV
jgi:hypothetical protein